MAYVELQLEVNDQNQAISISTDDGGLLTDTDIYLLTSWVETTVRNLLIPDGDYEAEDEQP